MVIEIWTGRVAGPSGGFDFTDAPTPRGFRGVDVFSRAAKDSHQAFGIGRGFDVTLPVTKRPTSDYSFGGVQLHSRRLHLTS